MARYAQTVAGWAAATGAALLLAGCATSSSGPGAATGGPASASASLTTVPDWPTLQTQVAQADALLATAENQGWWSGPVCNPDIEQHRQQAGQDPPTDEQLRAECAGNLAEFWASQQAHEQFEALDEAGRTAELARVGALLGLPAGQQPTVGQLIVTQGCERGWITDAASCRGVTGG